MSDTACAGLPAEGFARLPQFLGHGKAIPLSKSCWWEGVRTGRFPQPVKLSPRATAWRVDDIRAFIKAGGAGSPS